VTAVAAVVAVGGIAMTLYAVLGGADFGGGVWDLLASGPRAQAQRDAITHAIGPVWEANHVWVIYIIVLSFTCFPPAFADIAVGLYAPLSFALVGIVLRGAAFVFRNYATTSPALTRSWTVVFGIASLLAPFFLGDAIGSLATGSYAWLSPFALAVGAFAVTVCAQTAAVFILREIDDEAVRNDFRRRAVRATFAVWIVGLVPAILTATTQPDIFASLHGPLPISAVVVALGAGVVVIVSVMQRRDALARAAVALESAAILGGWFGGQTPYLVPHRYTFAQAASSDAMIVAFLVATGVGFLVLIPSLVLLFRVFKTTPRTTATNEGR
jgi:cytochrome d ubiquinol oxidase subunit II